MSLLILIRSSVVLLHCALYVVFFFTLFFDVGRKMSFLAYIQTYNIYDNSVDNENIRHLLVEQPSLIPYEIYKIFFFYFKIIKEPTVFIY